MKRTYQALVAILVILAILVVVDIWVTVANSHSKAVCHAITEDSDITDCDYQNGTWRTK
jgi:hypothetical protein